MQHPFDKAEAAGEFLVGAAESGLGVHPHESSIVHEREEKVAEFLLALRMGPASEGATQFLQFLAHLVPDVTRVVPVKADPGGALLNPVGTLEGGKVPGDAFEQ